ncbi:MAG: YciI family protein [Dehalococcoidia bacterium]
MRYLTVFYGAEREDAPGEDEIEAMGAFMNELGEAGYLLVADGLLPSTKGVKVRKDGDEFKVIDGPFAEAKEILGGFAIVDVPSIDVAIDITKRFMAIGGDGMCEVREMYPESAFPPA